MGLKVAVRSLGVTVSLLLSQLAFAGNAALIIIDMQPKFSERKGYLDQGNNREKLGQVIEKQRELIRLAKEKNLPIAVVEYENYGTTCDALCEEIGNYSHAQTFQKLSNGIFDDWGGIEKELKEFLKKYETKELVIAGANGGACVLASITGAIRDGYRVWADPKAIADFNYQSFVYPYQYEGNRLRISSHERVRFQQREGLVDLTEVLESSDAECAEAFKAG